MSTATAIGDALDIRQVMAAWTTGVTVITGQYRGRPTGLVSNSFTSVSLEPALVSWCVDRRSSSIATWLRCEAFAVHVLGAHESELVARFARKGGNKFSGLDWEIGRSGAPLIRAGIARLECRTWRQYDGGDHVILVGEVVDVSDSGGHALVFSRGSMLPAPLTA
ncbi:flavin reductase family protein [Kribbella sp. NPDC051620]|uniref:flavin reductase family protein n=1 Tax=Kribbella sp. NPDC051620 TaxID=3364120 RepID=UPI00379E82E6